MSEFFFLDHLLWAEIELSISQAEVIGKINVVKVKTIEQEEMKSWKQHREPNDTWLSKPV